MQLVRARGRTAGGNFTFFCFQINPRRVLPFSNLESSPHQSKGSRSSQHCTLCSVLGQCPWLSLSSLTPTAPPTGGTCFHVVSVALDWNFGLLQLVQLPKAQSPSPGMLFPPFFGWVARTENGCVCPCAQEVSVQRVQAWAVPSWPLTLP